MAKLRTYNTRRKIKALNKAGWHSVFKKTSVRRRHIAALREKQAQFARFVGSFDIAEDGALSFGNDAVEITQRLRAEYLASEEGKMWEAKLNAVGKSV